jgi:hypothetical protein
VISAHANKGWLLLLPLLALYLTGLPLGHVAAAGEWALLRLRSGSLVV